MGRSSRLFVHNRTYEICFRTEEGLPLVPSVYMAAILRGIVAKAQLLYPVTLCHAIVMNNHPHLLLVVKNPEDAYQFIGYLKRESAHAINRLLGRGRRTVWLEGYDCTLLLDTKKALERIIYFYLNPAKADLVYSIEDYPNLSTWGVFKKGQPARIEVKRIAREAICALPKRQLGEREQQALAEALLETSNEVLTLEIDPDAWLQTMVDGQGQNSQMLREEVIRRVSAQQERYEAKRRKPVLGALRLKLQSIQKSYRATKQGRKTFCLSSMRQLRIAVITWKKDYDKAWAELQRTLLPLERLINTPPGIFAPGGRMRSNLTPAMLPF
jgi:REP element-mobilizing transposase RayT